LSHNKYHDNKDFFEDSISSIVLENEETKIFIENTINDILDKFVEYYLGARFNDCTQVVLPKVN
jgi:vacuolar-type H+-ATPase subunit E/Vma4